MGHHQMRRGLAHGLRGTPEYKAWENMRARCYYKKDKKYPYYGKRGIRVCDQWRTSFLQFLNDMHFKPSTYHSLDRINNAGNYEPLNCRWATKRQQINNRSKKYNVSH